MWLMVLGIVGAVPALEPVLHRYGVDHHPDRPGRLHGLSRTIKPGAEQRRRASAQHGRRSSFATSRNTSATIYVIRNLNLHIAHNEFVVLLGQSGCGKTTTLRAIAGLETIDQGDILIDGKPVQHCKASDRDIAFVFQSLRALPASERATRTSPFRCRPRARAAARSTARCGAWRERCASSICSSQRPSALSGGDMQRVAIGRALVRRPKAMLMDEPIGALDAKLREEMRAEIKRLHIENRAPPPSMSPTTRSRRCALADRIAIMNEGVLQQVGTPGEVYQHPANLFVAQFVGSPVMNVAAGASVSPRRPARPASSATAHSRASSFRPNCRRGSTAEAANGRLALGIRPEGVLIVAARDA